MSCTSAISAAHHPLTTRGPSAQAERQHAYARVPFDFHHKQKRGRNVGKRELTEKHYRRAFGTSCVFGGNRLVENVLDLVPERPYPKLPHHVCHYKRHWKGQSIWLQEETAYELEDVKGGYNTKTATYSVSKPPKHPGYFS
ncbi:uncharacterized protein PG986_006565 [Apiospora aurea]|uniref:Uncharacterized protein n=1 Tax=Apiospora aurea TaxID=335848 RepID=A0ABR1QL46_9PEZI